MKNGIEEMPGSSPVDPADVGLQEDAILGQGILYAMYRQRFWVARRHVSIEMVNATMVRRRVQVTVDTRALIGQGSPSPMWNGLYLLPIATLFGEDDLGTEVYDSGGAVADRVPYEDVNTWLRAFLLATARDVLAVPGFPAHLEDLVLGLRRLPLRRQEIGPACERLAIRHGLSQEEQRALQLRTELLMSDFRFKGHAEAVTQFDRLVMAVPAEVMNRVLTVSFRYEVYSPLRRPGSVIVAPLAESPMTVASGAVERAARPVASNPWWRFSTASVRFGVGDVPSARLGIYDVWAPPETRAAAGGFVSHDGTYHQGNQRGGLFLRAQADNTDPVGPQGTDVAALIVHDGGGALLAATTFVTVSLILVVVGMFIAKSHDSPGEVWRLTTRGNESAVAILALLPAFAGPAYAARPHAHAMVRRVERGVRAALLLQFFGVVPPAAIVALEWEGDGARWTWIASGLFLCVLVAWLVFHYAIIWFSTRRRGKAVLALTGAIGIVLGASSIFTGVELHRWWLGPAVVGGLALGVLWLGWRSWRATRW